MKESIVKRTEGEWIAEVYNTYPSHTLELYRGGDRKRSIRYNSEAQARVDMAVALRWPDLFVRHGMVKDWPEDALRSAGL